MKIIAPYGIRINADGKIEVMPVVEARVHVRGDRSFLGIFVIDSGASTTLLPEVDAEALGIDMKSGKKLLVRGITGHQILGYSHEVAISIQEHTLERVPVIFSPHKDAPRVLGREGIFSHFGILFDESNRKTVFLDVITERRAIDNLSS